MVGDGEEVRFDWRRGGAAAAGLVAALVLFVLVILVKFANDAREKALDAERQANQVALVVRNVSANVSRADAALARFTLDEDVQGSGNVYASAWQLAGYQIRQLKALITSSAAHAVIEVDGGITTENAGAILDAGANVLVAGSTVFSSKDPEATILALKNA